MIKKTTMVLAMLLIGGHVLADTNRLAALERRVQVLEQWASDSETALSIARSRWYGTFQGSVRGQPIRVAVGDDGITYQGGDMPVAMTYPFSFSDGRITFNVGAWQVWLEHTVGGPLSDGRSRMKMRYRHGNAGPVYNTRLYRTVRLMPNTWQPLHSYEPLGVGVNLDRAGHDPIDRR